MRIPKQILIYDMNPVGPFISTGEVSEIYFGQKKLNDPQASPYINLPAISTPKDVTLSSMFSAITQIPDPTMTNIFVYIIQFHLPYFAKGPANNAPTAQPPVWND